MTKMPKMPKITVKKASSTGLSNHSSPYQRPENSSLVKKLFQDLRKDIRREVSEIQQFFEKEMTSLKIQVDCIKGTILDELKSARNLPTPESVPENIARQNFDTKTSASFNNFKLIEICAFDGSTSWDEYLKLFEVIAQFNNYTEVQKAAILVTSLRGPAMSVLGILDKDDLLDYNKLKNELQFKYGKERFYEAIRFEFRERKQKFNEELADFAFDLKYLVQNAFPKDDEEIKDARACEQFVDGLQNKFIQKHLLDEYTGGQMLSLDEALIRAKFLQANYSHCCGKDIVCHSEKN